jgi:hypothetical protein
MTRLLLIGKIGQVGYELRRTLAPLAQVTAVDFPEIDLTNGDSIRKWVRDTKPTVIINAAAYTAVDKAESESELAMKINGIAPGILADEAKKLGALLVHYSTDYIFDGTKTNPYVETDAPNPLELFQIWLNLPAADKMVEPYFTMLWATDIPVVTFEGGSVTIVAGALGDAKPASPPPNSWAARDDAEVAIWVLRLDAGASWTMPATHHPDVARTLYFFEGASLSIDDHRLASSTGAVLRSDIDVEVRAGDSAIECLVLQGRPIGEPVAQYGPFVMNTRAEIEQAFSDYQRTGFGGWPWEIDGPVHPEPGRFARHPGGLVEHPE